MANRARVDSTPQTGFQGPLSSKQHPLEKPPTQSHVKVDAVRSRLPQVALGAVRRVAWWTSGEVAALEFAPDGRLLAIGGDAGNLFPGGAEVRSTRDWKPRAFFRGSASFAWSPDSRLIAMSAVGVDIWDVTSQRVVRNLSDGTGVFPRRDGKRPGVYGPLLFSEDGRRLATLGENPNSTWKLPDGPLTEAAYVRGLALKVWDVRSGKRLLVKRGPSSGTFSPRALVPMSRNGRKSDFAFWTSHSLGVSRSRPRVYAYASYANQYRLFRPNRQPNESFVEIALASNPYRVSVAQNGWLYAWSNANQNTVNVCQSRDEKRLLRLVLGDQLSAIALSPDARLLAVAFSFYRTKTLADGSIMPISNSKVEVYDLGARQQTEKLRRPQKTGTPIQLTN